MDHLRTSIVMLPAAVVLAAVLPVGVGAEVMVEVTGGPHRVQAGDALGMPMPCVTRRRQHRRGAQDEGDIAMHRSGLGSANLSPVDAVTGLPYSDALSIGVVSRLSASPFRH